MESDEPEVRFRGREERLVDVPGDKTDSRFKWKPWASEVEIDRLLEFRSEPLDAETEHALVVRAQSGDASAKELLWRHSLKMIVRLAQPTRSLRRADLVAVGTEALFKALDKFDARKGVLFSTYAFPWIKFAIQTYIYNTGDIIRLPTYRRILVRRLGRSIQLHLNLYGVAPRVDELAKEHGISESEVMVTLAAENYSDVVVFDPVLEDPGVCASAESQPEFVAQQRDIERFIKEMLDSLEARERYVLLMRFPLDGSNQRTLEQIGQVLGISRQRVDRIVAAALKKLRFRYLNRIPAFLEVKPEIQSVEVSSWKDDLFITSLRHLKASRGQTTRAELTEVLRKELESERNQFVIEAEDGDTAPDEIVYFVVEHLITKEFIRSAFGGGDIVLTESGLAWLESKAQNLGTTRLLERAIRCDATTGSGRASA